MPLHNFYRTLAGIALAALLCACVHRISAPAVPDQTTQQGTAMNQQPTARPPAGQITIHDYPELTPDEVGRRFLKLVGSLGTGKNLQTDDVAAETKLPLTHIPDLQEYRFRMYLPDSGWFYHFAYFDNPKPALRSVRYSFANIDDISAVKMLDMTPVCGLDLGYYRAALLKMGFIEGPPHYDVFEEKRGRLLGYQFSRGATLVSIRPQREGNSSDIKISHECVNEISVTSGDEAP